MFRERKEGSGDAMMEEFRTRRGGGRNFSNEPAKLDIRRRYRRGIRRLQDERGSDGGGEEEREDISREEREK